MMRSDRLRGFVRRPTAEEIVLLGAREHLDLTASEASMYVEILDEMLDEFDRLDEMPCPQPALRHLTRDPGFVPTPEEDPLHAFIRRCEVRGAESGPLSGLRAAVKDNIHVAGVPTTNGSRMAHYVPTRDAVVVERLLDGGATIVGKLNMDEFGSGGLGEQSAWGPPRNPWDRDRSAGGSSGGAGAAVAAGLIDVGIGVDQGGSGRIPAAFCGVVGHKPSLGLVPSHGLVHTDHTMDSVCPLARTVEETARALDAISGYDERDPQWGRATPDATRCTDMLDRGVEGLRIGVIREARRPGLCEQAVETGLDDATRVLADAGATLVEVSIPIWEDSWSVFIALAVQLGWASIQSEGQGYGHLGEVDPDHVRAFALSRRLEANEFPPFTKVWLILGRYLHEQYFSVHVARSRNLRRVIGRQLDDALIDCDLLLTPTTPMAAPELLTGRPSEAALLDRGFVGVNTAPLNVSGHPALAVPSGLDAAGLPVSVQLIARRLEDEMAFRAGAVVERGLSIGTVPVRE